MASEVTTPKKDAAAFSLIEADEVKSKSDNVLTWEGEILVYEGDILFYTDY